MNDHVRKKKDFELTIKKGNVLIVCDRLDAYNFHAKLGTLTPEELKEFDKYKEMGQSFLGTSIDDVDEIVSGLRTQIANIEEMLVENRSKT